MKQIKNKSLLGLTIHSAYESIIVPFSSFGKIRTLSALKATKAIKKVLKSLKLLTLDLETRRLVNGELEVISSAIYCPGVGKDYLTHYLTDYPTEYDLLETIVKDLINPRYNGYNLYIHNFSLFDAIFLFKHILNLSRLGYLVDFLKREDKFISITISKYDYISYINKKGEAKTRKVTTFKLTIYDSLLILPQSLKDLSKAFKVEGKLNFNVLDNDTADLNDPNFKSKLLDYNKQDCKALYDVLVTFNNNFEHMFNINIWDSPTLPSLAYKLFTSKFLDKEVEVTWAEQYKDFKEAYRGGAVDVYKPHGENLYYYDVNSLYPYVMKTNLYPTGYSSYFEGDIIPLKDIFGLVYCNIIAPTDLYTPILLTKTLDGKVIAPVGSWSGWYCSEELKHAVEHGYYVEVIKGYHWGSRSDLFSEYVDTLYNFRLTFDKNDPRNFICKILLNSLYGKFGMSPILMSYSIWEDSEYESLADAEYDDIQHIGDVTVIGREGTKNLLSSYKYCQDKKINFPILQISTPIAIFTTAYARIHMGDLKIKYKNNLYYSDTDSLILDCELPESLVGKELGLSKLECRVKEGIFLAPKTYYLDVGLPKPIIKVKGLKNTDHLTLDNFKSLLNKDSFIKVTQEKWFRDLSLGNIQIIESAYTLRSSENKRDFIYNPEGVIIDTKPISLCNPNIKPHG